MRLRSCNLKTSISSLGLRISGIRHAALVVMIIAITGWGRGASAGLSVFGEPAKPGTAASSSARATTASVPSSTTGAADVREVFRLNTAIKEKRERLQELRERIGRYRQSIANAQATTRTLRGQLAVVEDRIQQQLLAIEAVRTEREQLELEIAAIRLDLSLAGDRIARQRKLLAALLTELATAEQRTPIHAVLAHASVGEYFAERSRLNLLQSDLRRLLVDVRSTRDRLQTEEETLADRQRQLAATSEHLEDEQAALREQQEAKQRLLTTTRQSEARYQDLLQDLRAEQEAIDSEITRLDASVRERLEAIDKDFGRLGRVAFSWPVPNRGITTTFRDPEYPFRHIFEHPGIDIRAAQGAPIAAAAPGYVARAKDAGYGYSYLMIIHPGGFATVYGHVSQINVAEDTYVTRGQVIGYTGGRPGTRGAGRLTTGPHLHLEIRLNGIPVNPVNYLL